MADVQFLIRPHQQQIRFMNCGKPEQLFGGAKRGGKSVALCQKIVALSMAFPGNRGILIRQNLTDLKDSTLVTFFKVCPPSLIARHHLGDRKITFINGSHFIYRGVGDPDELEKVKGIDVGWMASDEPSEIDESTYLMLLAQMNWILPNGKRPPYMSMLACNPEPGWVKIRFIDIMDTGGHPDREFIPSLAADNPGLPPGYIAFLRANFPEEWVKKYVEGSWEVSEGMVYKEFSRSVHVVDYLPPLSEMLIYGALDHATTGVTAKIDMGITANHDHFIIHEYYEKDKLVKEHAASVIDRIAWYQSNGFKYEYTLIDPATSQKSSQGNYQLQAVRDIYQEAGLDTIPAWNLIEAGVERVKQLLKPSLAHIHWQTLKPNAPHLYVHSSCLHTIDEFMSWKKKVTPDGHIKYAGNDHCLDDVRYIINSRPKPPVMSTFDEQQMDTTSRQAHRSHSNWAKKWDKAINDPAQHDHFSYFNQGDPK